MKLAGGHFFGVEQPRIIQSNLNSAQKMAPIYEGSVLDKNQESTRSQNLVQKVGHAIAMDQKLVTNDIIKHGAILKELHTP